MITIENLQKACYDKYGISVEVEEILDQNHQRHFQFSVFDGDADGYIGIASLNINDFTLDGIFGGGVELGEMICDACAFIEYEDLIYNYAHFDESPEGAAEAVLNCLTPEQFLNEIMSFIYYEIEESIRWEKTVLEVIK